MYNSGTGSKRLKLSVDQICSSVASAAARANERGNSSSQSASIHLPPATQSHSASAASSTYEALNLSITSPSSTSSAVDCATAAHRKHSWPIERGSGRSSLVNALHSETPRGLSSATFESTKPNEDSGKERRRRQKLANKDNLFCQVCGDKANGYNFGAITCESCKAFFRRNALKNKDLRCNFDNSCKIDHFTRKFCTACRLNKCFSVNMKKEWILDEDALKKRKKLTRRSAKDDGNIGDYDPPTFPTLPTSQAFSASAVTSPQMSGLYMYIDPTVSTPSDASTASEDIDYPPLPLSDEERAEIARIMTNHAQISSNSTSADSSPVSPPSQEEQYAKGHWQNQSITTDQAMEHSAQALDIADEYIRKIIKFVKSLSEYRDMDQSDQIVLLKSGIMETLVMRSAIMYNPPMETSTLAQEIATAASLRRRSKSGAGEETGDDLFAEHSKLVKNINTAVKWDKQALVLALIINLFSTERAPVTHIERVKRAEERYSLLLQAYLRSKHTHYDARTMYHQLFQRLSDVKSYSEACAQHIARVTPGELEPLMKEIFSMT